MADESLLIWEARFLEQLDAIERAIAFVCRRGSLTGADAEDFESYVKLKLIEDGYAVIRKFENRCSFSAYVAVVVQRLLLDYRSHLWGKWHPSAEAKRLGEVAMAIEAMLFRDRLTLSEAVSAVSNRWPQLTETNVIDIVKRLPARRERPRSVALEMAYGLPARSDIDDSVCDGQRASTAAVIAAVVQEVVASFGEEDYLIFRLRFEAGVSVANISRMLAVEQKPLYRRLNRLLDDLRSKLRRAGIDAADAEDVIGNPSVVLDFGFASGTSLTRPSNQEKTSRTGESEGV